MGFWGFGAGRDVGSSLRSAFAGLRVSGEPIQGQVTKSGPKNLTCRRGGVNIRAEWLKDAKTLENPDMAQSVGRYAAALALPLMGDVAAEAWARSHSLCTHMTSLVLVDDAGEVSQGFSQMRKLPMMEPASYPSKHLCAEMIRWVTVKLLKIVLKAAKMLLDCKSSTAYGRKAFRP